MLTSRTILIGALFLLLSLLSWAQPIYLPEHPLPDWVPQMLQLLAPAAMIAMRFLTKEPLKPLVKPRDPPPPHWAPPPPPPVCR
jgi:hypothetical protein